MAFIQKADPLGSCAVRVLKESIAIHIIRMKEKWYKNNLNSAPQIPNTDLFYLHLFADKMGRALSVVIHCFDLNDVTVDRQSSQSTTSGD